MTPIRKPDHLLKSRLIGLLLIAALMPIAASAELPPLSNQLKHHPSPYLALHGNDPVHWQDWGAAVVKRARAENKLIFVSSGYFSCHWCHVMQRESFADPEVAKLLNQLAVPVKVDRELQPALDAWLIDFTERTTGRAGWPLNVFLTPDGYPLVGMTYLPKKNFLDLLQQLQTRWNEGEEYFRTTAMDAFKSMQPDPQSHPGENVEPGADQELAEMMTSQAMQLADDTAGGFGEQNKFPMSPQIRTLLEIQASFPDEKLQAFLKLTLDQMAQLGLRDHVGGGFYRYTVDPGWEIPHFEKMLYDNAQLIDIYLRAAEVFNQPAYQQVALDTLDFVMEAMQAANGAYIASLSAVDNKNVEGGYYLWQVDELKTVLNKNELKVVTAIWDVTGTPELEAGHHFKFAGSVDEIAKQLKLTASEANKILSSARNKLKQTRKQRKLPADNKVLAAWNGLLLTGISKAVSKTKDKRYRKAGEKLYRVLAKQLWDGTQLSRFLHKGKAGGRVSLEDYAYVSQGIAAWAAASADKQALDTAKKIALAGLQRFHNDSGWQLSEELIIPYDARELVLDDNVMPSPSATLLSVLFDISQQQGDDALKRRILHFVDADHDGVTSAPLWYGSQIQLIHQILKNSG